MDDDYSECKMCEKNADRIAELEGLLREALGALMGDYEVNPHDLGERIKAALKEKA